MKNLLGLALVAALATGASAQWSDNFDSYANGQQLHGVNGWAGWDGNPAGGALASNAQSSSAPNSVAIVGASDLTHQYSGVTSGQWVYSADMFVPTAFTGTTYFILLNAYDGSGVGYNWSVQVEFNGTTNQVVNDGASLGTLSLVRGQWVGIRNEIDLDANTQSFYYGNQLLYSGTWTEEVSGGGTANLAAVDLFANGASTVYYDNMALSPVPEPMTLAVLGVGALGLLRRRRK